MELFSIDNPNLWGRGTEGMEIIAEEGGMDGISLANFVLGEVEDNAPVATMMRLAPGMILPHHGHNCHRFEVIVQGSVTLNGRVLKPGTIMHSKPGGLYGPYLVGPDGCTTVEIFSKYEATHKTLAQDVDGVVECDLATREGAHRMVEIVKKQVAELTA